MIPLGASRESVLADRTFQAGRNSLGSEAHESGQSPYVILRQQEYSHRSAADTVGQLPFL